MANTTHMGCAGAIIGVRMSKNARQIALDVLPTFLAATMATRIADGTTLPLLAANEVNFNKYVYRFGITTNVPDTGVADRSLILTAYSRSGRAMANTPPIPIAAAGDVAAITALLVTANAALASKKIVLVAKYVVH